MHIWDLYDSLSSGSKVVKNKILVTPKKINTENSEIIIVNGDQTLPTVIQINHKLKNSGQKKNQNLNNIKKISALLAFLRL